MRNKESGEFELVVGNRQLLSGFFIVVVLFGVAFAMGYVVGQNAARPSGAAGAASAGSAASEAGPLPASRAPAPPAEPAAQPPADGSPEPAREARGVPATASSLRLVAGSDLP